jgi:hypothetical protein
MLPYFVLGVVPHTRPNGKKKTFFKKTYSDLGIDVLVVLECIVVVMVGMVYDMRTMDMEFGFNVIG